MDSILDSTKRVLGLAEDYTAFDVDVVMHINAAFSSLSQLGVGPVDGFFIVDSTAVWDDIGIPAKQLHLLKSYIYLKVRFAFDPPTTSFAIDAMDKQIKEYEWRLNIFREELLPPVTVPPEEEL